MRPAVGALGVHPGERAAAGGAPVDAEPARPQAADRGDEDPADRDDDEQLEQVPDEGVAGHGPGYATTTPSSASSGAGNCGSMARSVSTRMVSTAQFRYHFRSAGTTYQGAAAVVVWLMASRKAAW